MNYQNKNFFPQNPFEFNIFRNDRPQRWNKRDSGAPQTNPINHLSNRHHSTILQNPQKQKHLSYSKTVPLNNQVMRERSQMIIHPSKVSKDGPHWMKGNTYKYYGRNQYNNLYHDLYTIDAPSKQINRAYDNRSEASTPRSRQSDQSDNFYIGGGHRQPYARRPQLKKIQKEISPKIGSTQNRSFRLPKVQVKIGHQDLIV